jgi:hypothetical protein
METGGEREKKSVKKSDAEERSDGKKSERGRDLCLNLFAALRRKGEKMPIYSQLNDRKQKSFHRREERERHEKVFFFLLPCLCENKRI